MEVPGQQGNEVMVEVIEIVELEEHAKRHGTHAPHAKHYAFRVDKTRVVVDTPTSSGAPITKASSCLATSTTATH
jgi:hypothetical protein